MECTDASSLGSVLIVDDEKNVLSSLMRLLRPLGCKTHTAMNGIEGLSVLEEEKIDVIISDMRMPEMDGAVFLERAAHLFPETIRFLLTGYADMESTIAAINKGRIHNYISKPWDDDQIKLLVTEALEKKKLIEENARLNELTKNQNIQLKELNESLEVKVAERTKELSETLEKLESAHTELQDSYYAAIPVFASLIELREGEFSGHCRRVAEQAKAFCTHLELDDDEIRDINFAALLHNVGKLALPDNLINKPYVDLQFHEKEKLNNHPVIGETALLSLDKLKNTGKIIRHQHEHVSGKGFPDKLSGNEIPLGSRILSILVDYDELQLGLIEQKKYQPNMAKSYLKAKSKVNYDKDLVEKFIDFIEKFDSDASLTEETKIRSSDLKEGMVLSRDLVTEDGMLLLTKGKQLDASMIERVAKIDRDYEEYLKIFVINNS